MAVDVKDDRITIALVWPKYDGGVTSVSDLLVGLDKSRFEVIFIYLSSDGAKNNHLEEAGYKVFYLSDIGRLNAFRFSILFRLVKILKAHKVDILHCHAHKPTVYGTIAATLAGTPVIMAHVHGLGRTGNFKRKLTNLFLFRRIDRFLPVADAVKEDMVKSNWFLSPEKIEVLENSIEYSRFADISISKEEARRMLGLSDDGFVFGTVGRLSPTKGQSYLIEAFAKVKQEIPSAQLVFIGCGPLEDELKEQARSTGTGDSVHFLGYRSDIPQALRSLDVFVLPSVAEGMPRTILEAMAAGVPCIGTRVGAIPEMLDGDGIGCVVDPRDPEALGEAMIMLGRMPDDDRRRLSEKASQKVRRLYTHEIVAKKLKDTYEAQLQAQL